MMVSFYYAFVSVLAFCCSGQGLMLGGSLSATHLEWGQHAAERPLVIHSLQASMSNDHIWKWLSQLGPCRVCLSSTSGKSPDKKDRCGLAS